MICLSVCLSAWFLFVFVTMFLIYVHHHFLILSYLQQPTHQPAAVSSSTHFMPSAQPSSHSQRLHHATIINRDSQPVTTDPNLHYTDEPDAYTAFTMKGHFTANPQETVESEKMSETADVDEMSEHEQLTQQTQTDDAVDEMGSHSEGESETFSETVNELLSCCVEFE